MNDEAAHGKLPPPPGVQDSSNGYPDRSAAPPPPASYSHSPDAGTNPIGPPPWGASGPQAGGYHPGVQGMRPAGIGLRIGGYLIDSIGLALIDFIIRAVVTVAFFAATEATNGLPFLRTGVGFGGRVLLGLVGVAITLAYFGFMEANNGQTIGKKLVNIRAVKTDGTSLELGDAVKRRLPFVIGSLIPIPFLGRAIGFAFILAVLITTATDQPRNRGLHDKFAKSMVIRA